MGPNYSVGVLGRDREAHAQENEKQMKEEVEGKKKFKTFLKTLLFSPHHNKILHVAVAQHRVIPIYLPYFFLHC